MTRWRLFYHVVWTTKSRHPVLDADAEGIVGQSIRTTCLENKSILHAIGMMPDHVHVAVSIPPSIAVAHLVGRMKGASAHAVNAADGARAFAWQEGYGVSSFGEKNLSDVIAYVDNQHERHATQRLWLPLESTTDKPEAGNSRPSAGLSESARRL